MSALLGLAGIAALGAGLVGGLVLVEAALLALLAWLLDLPKPGLARAVLIGALAATAGAVGHGFVAPWIGTRLTALGLYVFWILLVEEIFDTTLDRAWVCCSVAAGLEAFTLLVAVLVGGPGLAPGVAVLRGLLGP